MKRIVVEVRDIERLSPIFNGKAGHWLAKLVMRIFAMDKVNSLYERSCDQAGAAFAASLLKDLGVNYSIGNIERLHHLPEGAFITVSNHPYGGIDGIMLIDLMAGIRPDYKVMVNQVLSLVEAMEENFISVKPRVGHKALDATASVNGVRETLMRLQEGHPMGFFPAGAVSMFRFSDLRVKDREWQKSIVKLIQRVKVPIVPIRFFDQNSPLFYALGIIDWRIRLIRMPYELFNKSGKRTRIGIGNIISVEEQAQFSDICSFGRFLQKAVYKMPKPDSFISKDDFRFPDKTTQNSK